MFVDSALAQLKAGRGGDGAVSFRHEIYVDKGGPDGGDGGRGGNIVFLADERKNTLVDFRFKPEVKAKDGGRGGKRKMHGKNGDDTIVSVPVGTQVYRDDMLIADLVKKDQKTVIAKGGDGGFGNAHFKSSTRQTPRVAELGEKGEEFEVRLELKLLADVGLIGFPNAGKSTFLSVVSNARPEIGDYEFTTLEPNLGVAQIDDGQLLIADIPGLIEGASDGKGLGDAFLRHVERTAVLLHMIDSYSNDIAAAYKTIRKELESYSSELVKRPEIVVLSKIDGLDDELVAMQKHELMKIVPKGTPVFAISSSAHKGLETVLRQLRQVVDSSKKEQAEQAMAETDIDAIPVVELPLKVQDEGWRVTKEDDRFRVTGVKIEKFAAQTDFSNYHGENRLRDIMYKMGIAHELRRAGATGESIVVIGETSDYQLTLEEQ